MSSFANDGGPLIALDATALTQWHGVGDDTAQDIPPGSDYARACAAGHPAGFLPVADTYGVIVGAQEGVSDARWWEPAEPGTIYLIGSVFGDEASDLTLMHQLSIDGVAGWSELGVLALGSGQLTLFHAACAGAEIDLDPPRPLALIGDGLSQPVPPGAYRVSATEVTIGQDGLYNVVRWSYDARSGYAAV
jgi:hypothetical protein